MALTPGTRVGPYEVVAHIGVGGMGEVYRARDTKLNRDVALKILPDAFANDRDRLARFEREAHVLASLNHPNIAAIYGFEDSQSIHALVLELVDGPTLADRIAQGPIPIDEAVPIARQIAEALDVAHERASIHRDVKPSNIKLRPDGTVKVLDFGLAKALDPIPTATDNVSSSPTITSPAMTRMGMILGTAAYMAPEQAKGKAVDKRTDIWAFGCVLYEMLIGKRAFSGDDVAEVLAFVLTRDPDWTALPVATPFAIRQLIRRCLEKDPKRRLRDIGDAFPDLGEQGIESANLGPTLPTDVHIWQRPAPALIGMMLAVGITALLVWVITRTNSAKLLPLSKFELSLPLDIPGIAARPSAALTVSPDGSTIVYVGRSEGASRLFRRVMSQLQGVAIAGSENGRAPFFSPDGSWIGFEADDGTIKRLPLGGGSPQVTAQIPGGSLQGASWGKNGTIVFAGTRTGLLRVSITGGDQTPLTTPDAKKGEFHSLPEVLPGERAALFNAGDRIEVVLLETGERRVLLHGWSPHFSPTGHLVFARGNSTWAVRFDPVGLKVLGEPVKVLEGVEDVGVAQMVFSQNGTLAYLPTETLRVDITRNARLAIVNREGRATTLPYEPGRYLVPRLAPGGQRLVVFHENDLWVLEIDRPARTRLTFNGGRVPENSCLGFTSVWTHGGTRVAFVGTSSTPASNTCPVDTIYTQRSDSSLSPERLFTGQNATGWFPTSWSPLDSAIAVYTYTHGPASTFRS